MWFDLLYRQHSPKMIRTAQRVLGSYQAAEDVVQNVFLIALAHKNLLQTFEQPAAWLYKALRHQIGNELQKAKRHNDLPIEYAFDLAAIEEDPPLSDAFSAEMHTQDREILILFFEQQRSHEEIATLLNISVTASKTRLFRAKKHYQKFLLELT